LRHRRTRQRQGHRKSDRKKLSHRFLPSLVF
jgi:hypothetical protein